MFITTVLDLTHQLWDKLPDRTKVQIQKSKPGFTG